MIPVIATLAIVLALALALAEQAREWIRLGRMAQAQDRSQKEIMPTDIIDIFHTIGIIPIQNADKEWSSACPFCGGIDRCRIWPEKQNGRGHYWCRLCGAQGDGIQLQKEFV